MAVSAELSEYRGTSEGQAPPKGKEVKGGYVLFFNESGVVF
jgi:hypothetical protein